MNEELEFQSQPRANVIVLAGGQASRMGRPKSLLMYDDTHTFLEHILSIYAGAAVARAVVVLSAAMKAFEDEWHRKAEAMRDWARMGVVLSFHDDPRADQMASVRRGLQHTEGGAAVYVQDVDRPFVTVELLKALLEHGKSGFAAPNINGHGGHPMLLSMEVARAVSTSKAPTLRDALHGFERTLVEVADTSCNININTPEEYERYFAHVRKIAQ